MAASFVVVFVPAALLLYLSLAERRNGRDVIKLDAANGCARQTFSTQRLGRIARCASAVVGGPGWYHQPITGGEVITVGIVHLFGASSWPALMHCARWKARLCVRL